jgi:hypothetical protein
MKFGRTVNQKDIAAYHRHRKVQHEKHKKYFQNSTKPRHESSEEHGIVFDSDAAAKHLPSARPLHCHCQRAAAVFHGRPLGVRTVFGTLEQASDCTLSNSRPCSCNMLAGHSFAFPPGLFPFTSRSELNCVKNLLLYSASDGNASISTRQIFVAKGEIWPCFG